MTPEVNEGLNWVLGGGLLAFLIKEAVLYLRDRARRLTRKADKQEGTRLEKIELEIHDISHNLRGIELTLVKHDASELKSSLKELSADIQELSSALAVDRARIEAENKNRDAALIELRADLKVLQLGGRHAGGRG